MLGAVKQTTVRNLSIESRLACWRFMIESVELCPVTERMLLGVEAIAFYDADCIGFAGVDPIRRTRYVAALSRRS
jgi:hypothetical protein